MLAFALKRTLVALLVAVTVSIISFTLLRLSGDLAQALAGPSATAADVIAVRKAYGLDQPIAVQYLEWAGKALRGDFGDSFFFKEPVWSMIATRLPVTMTLGICALFFALIVAIPLGVLAALRPNSWIDRLALTLSVFGQALPSFWFALMLMILFGLKLRWLPISGTGTWQHYVMPAIALGYYGMPAFMRLTRAGMIVIESVFALHGVGYLGLESISRADFPVVQAIVLILAAIYIVLTLVADLLNAFLDPRI